MYTVEMLHHLLINDDAQNIKQQGAGLSYEKSLFFMEL
jgi:hypothetical protein